MPPPGGEGISRAERRIQRDIERAKRRELRSRRRRDQVVGRRRGGERPRGDGVGCAVTALGAGLALGAAAAAARGWI